MTTEAILERLNSIYPDILAADLKEIAKEVAETNARLDAAKRITHETLQLRVTI